jgi:hypothetical protein
MTMPLRKDQAEAEQLTTADLAGTRNANDVAQADVEAGRPKPVRSERNADLQAEPRPGSAAADSTPLFPDDQLKDLQARWDDIQTGFVDEPRSAVEHADSLVASTMQQLAEAFAKERSKLEQQWDRGDNISTEDLRMAFQRYRSFFRRLLSMWGRMKPLASK